MQCSERGVCSAVRGVCAVQLEGCVQCSERGVCSAVRGVCAVQLEGCVQCSAALEAPTT